ncbi:unnamed protein product [Vitrella brassicaformis CCMP3155]|uniref:Uncharacterized protein n=1 Tax=Vitrella brassicaformis (strain CCMP3155) TaxID=1169540 RepID=A0A0G4EWP2_VITBC|nr:unnamed protein product [Vitrella brassicaformis CCMP3155]|eukprot:CEM02813.1 unnamed protein product [Vitrella brassicaformis CCMP3155]
MGFVGSLQWQLRCWDDQRARARHGRPGLQHPCVRIRYNAEEPIFMPISDHEAADPLVSLLWSAQRGGEVNPTDPPLCPAHGTSAWGVVDVSFPHCMTK